MELAEQAAELLLSKTREVIRTKPSSALTGTKRLPGDITKPFMKDKFDQMISCYPSEFLWKADLCKTFVLGPKKLLKKHN